ncbi:Panacea domain-containing protein [Streptococcus uberis]|uniref:Panacea domain-containing protein n=1 Tax=Streptococcus uberis TaxID=1349 RepID=UPI00193A0A06|nr:Panacea domain-containing protein [Streptococcus uberis]MCK1239382.1 Panacea domain-containing protein [Streptococcus uberis]
MINTINLAKCFLSLNPSLKVGNYDNNLKINKLLYFSSLMYYSIFHDNLLDENFERWNNGPVVREVYKGFRYNGLMSNTDYTDEEFNTETKSIIQIVNFIYGNKTSLELSNETHTHNIWIQASQNEILDFKKLDPTIIKYMETLYTIYKDIDFDNLYQEVIYGNHYYYFDKDIDLSSNESLMELQNIGQSEFPIFVELIDGELVFS